MSHCNYILAPENATIRLVGVFWQLVCGLDSTETNRLGLKWFYLEIRKHVFRSRSVCNEALIVFTFCNQHNFLCFCVTYYHIFYIIFYEETLINSLNLYNMYSQIHMFRKYANQGDFHYYLNSNHI